MPGDQLATLARLRRGAARNGYQPEPRSDSNVMAASGGKKRRTREVVLVGEVFANFYASKGVAKKLLLPQIAASWEQIVGELVAEHSSPKAIDGEALKVVADSSVWAAQLSALGPMVVARITEITGSSEIVRVQVQGPKVNVPNYGPRKAKGAIGYRDTFG